MKDNMKRTITTFLAIVMMLAFMPALVFADGNGAEWETVCSTELVPLGDDGTLTLTAETTYTGSSPASYQWFEVDNDLNYKEIPGATDKTYKVTKAGIYAFRVTIDGVSKDGICGVGSPKIKKTAHPAKVKGKTVTVKYSKLKKKAQKIAMSKAFKFTNFDGDDSIFGAASDSAAFKKLSGNKKITVSKNGKITVKKGLKKKTYKVKVQVKIKDVDGDYLPVTRKATVTIKVK